MELVPIDSVQPSTYNPRLTDPQRLDLIELSLRKLGFLLPLYASESGEILSGHQRHLVAERMGLKQVPVEWLPDMELKERMNLNVVFNRATNDLDSTTTSQDVTQALLAADVYRMASQLPDLPDETIINRVFQMQVMPLADLIEANMGTWNEYAKNISRALYRWRLVMPVILRPNKLAVNGIGRIQFLAERGEESVETLTLSEAEADFAGLMLNLLSMDFNIHERYADILRHNSFRRARDRHAAVSPGLGQSYLVKAQNNHIDFENAEHRSLMRQALGARTLDFGAGHRVHQPFLDKLRACDIEADAFEPYPLPVDTGNEIQLDLARAYTERFLERVAEGVCWNTIFLQAVLNSVPFDADRQHVLRLLQTLAAPFTQVVITVPSLVHMRQQILGDSLHRAQVKSMGFRLDYEEHVKIAEFASLPKVQKYFTLGTLRSLVSPYFQQLQYGTNGGYHIAIAQNPTRLDFAKLRESIAFEFDLPYPNGERLGMAEAALDAFSQRLGVTL